MNPNEIIAGEYYWSIVSGRLCPVRVVSWVRKCTFSCINVETGRVIARTPYQIISPLTEDERQGLCPTEVDDLGRPGSTPGPGNRRAVR